MHENKKMYLPKIIKYIDSKEIGLSRDFEDRFIQQWTALKSEYIDLLHGELSMVISFGMFYVMNIQQNINVNVMELNKFFTTILLRKKDLRKKMKKKNNEYVTVPYTFSYQPVVHQSPDTLCGVLENLGFSNLCMETNILIRIVGKDPVTFQFRKNGDLWAMNFADIKWSMITVIPESSQGVMQPTNIRFRLQSFRSLNRNVVGLIEEYKPLVESTHMLKTTDGYILDAFFQNKNIYYATEKVTKIYRNLDSINDLSQSLKVEVSRVTELKLNDEKTKLIRSASSRVEVNLCPSLPSLESSNDELKSYARYILDKALTLAIRFDVIRNSSASGSDDGTDQV